MPPPGIRDARAEDAARLLAVYAPIVAETAISFELVPPTEEELAARIEAAVRSHAWVVAELEGEVAGYAYGGPHRARGAYRYSTETSAYVAAGYRRRGVGRALYGALLERLRARGYCQAYAGITLPNDASVALHAAVGFEPVGVFRSVGWKLGRWHDVSWWHAPLRTGAPAVEPPPRP